MIAKLPMVAMNSDMVPTVVFKQFNNFSRIYDRLPHRYQFILEHIFVRVIK
ncbi:hypothetical protein YK48G_18090 [Lentilactobacillus fungorum]|uniref:Uncharacterized protein n=1 Tax=Lentilactobacillus fungorum TaxID=2201250 RepID=A0ABQ3W1D4_9LACO|nr:hypothetical protein YK48G_18090 [Lentilactobacillus fungorum]